EPPASPTTEFVPTPTAKSPRGPSLETSSSFSWYGSGSVQTFQPKLPSYWRASLTSRGVNAGRVALRSAIAPVTWGAAIDVPDMYANPPGMIDQMHLPGAIRSTSQPRLLKSANVSSLSYVPQE